MRALVGLAFMAACVAYEGLPSAEEMTAPVPVQAQILTRVLPFERNFTSRVKGSVVILLLEKTSEAESVNAVRQMETALASLGQIHEHPIVTEIVNFSNAAAVRSLCRSRNAHVVYVSPGLSGDIGGLARELAGSGVLSFAAAEPYVPAGAVLGVGIVAGKPKMSINLGQAKAQKIDLPASVLALAKVY